MRNSPKHSTKMAGRLAVASLVLGALVWAAGSLDLTGEARATSRSSTAAVITAGSTADNSAALVPGACCLGDGTCEVYEQGVCLQFSGTYLGADTTCDPMPCLNTPVRELSWGKLKAEYRETTATR